VNRAGVLLAAALGMAGGCRLSPLAHDECRADEDCVSPRICMAGRCQARASGVADAGADAAVDQMAPTTPDAEAPVPDVSEAPPPDVAMPAVTKRRYLGVRESFIAAGDGLSNFAPAIYSPRLWRADFFRIGLTGNISHGSFADTALVGFHDPIPSEPATDGLDGTSAGIPHADMLTRGLDGELRHGTCELEVAGGAWLWQRIEGKKGQLRPALAHLGRGRLVAFQVGLDGKVWFVRFSEGQWGAWRSSTLTASAGLDATTLSMAGVAQSIALVSLDESGRPVMAVFSPDQDALGEWSQLGEPEGGAAAHPSITSFSESPSQYDVFVTSKSKGLWRRSFPPPEGESGFVAVPGAAATTGEIDVAGLSLTTHGHAIAIVRRTGNQVDYGMMIVEAVP
jgi:hypothetical protein